MVSPLALSLLSSHLVEEAESQTRDGFVSLQIPMLLCCADQTEIDPNHWVAGLGQ